MIRRRLPPLDDLLPVCACFPFTNVPWSPSSHRRSTESTRDFQRERVLSDRPRIQELGGAMSRLPALTRNDVASEDQEIWEGLVARRNGQIRGPFSALVYAPRLAERVEPLIEYFRGTAELPDTARELVILATTREAGARYAWSRHELIGRQVGVRDEAIEILRAHGALDGLTPQERLVVEVVRELLRTNHLSDGLYARAEAELGRRQLVEVVTLTGFYHTLGLLLGGFEIPALEDDAPGF